MTSSIELSELKEQLAKNELVQNFNDDKDKTGSFLFISFDLVNSTAFKSIHPQDWPVIFQRFYELIETTTLKNFTNLKVWRYAGDEILFYKQINKVSELYNAPVLALKILKSVNEALNNNHEQTKNILFLKSTLWVAEATYITSHAIDKEKPTLNNLIFNYETKTRNVDFLGSDIDLGFRISKFAQRDKVVVSAELAYLLYKDREKIEEIYGYDVTEDLRIVSYEKLKGIWNNRHYPIIWYNDSWKNPDEMFFYDEHYDSEIIAKLKKGNFTDEMRIKRLKKIFNEVDNNNKIFNIIKCIDEKEDIEVLPSTSQYYQTEVHCVAVCFNNEGKILIAKRPAHKKRLPNVWEFGCGQMKKFQDFQECLIESYKEDFYAELNFFGNLMPISTYVLEDAEEGRKIPGIIFIAKILNQQEVESHFSKANHSEVRWFDVAELSDIQEEQYVDDFKDTVIKAVEAWRKLTQGD